MKVAVYPDPILKTPAVPVGAISENLKDLAEQMLQLMYDSHGIGLAATQVGLAVRMFVMDVQKSREESTSGMDELDAKQSEIEYEDDDQPLQPNQPKVILNPEILEASGEVTTEEGCLSIPGIKIDVTRFNQITVRYTNLEGSTLEESLAGIHAVVFQHELDHLNGVLIWDHLPPLERNIWRKKFLKKRTEKA